MTAAALTAQGHTPILAPCLVLAERPPKLPPPAQCAAILVTSSQALPGLPQEFRDCPLLAVGDATASRARALDFTRVDSASGTAADLAALASSRFHPRDDTLLLVCGAGQSVGLAKILRGRGFRVHRRVIYATRPATALNDAARQALAAGAVDRALFFSKTTAACFVALIHRGAMESSVRAVTAIAISQPVAEALRALPFYQIHTAIAPDQLHMLAMLP